MKAVSEITVAQNLHDILARIEAVRKSAVAPAPSTSLIAVTKTVAVERIGEALDFGHRVFGENRVQESLQKWPALKQLHSDIELHLIGPLQSNKVKEAVAHFDAIHALDRQKLALALRAEIDRSGRTPSLFIQINTGEEPQKAGVTPHDAPGFISYCRDELKLPIVGLMCIPPAGEEPSPHFALLRKIASSHGLAGLSMGMSGDFETAIRFGATHVRVGSAIFGNRNLDQ